MKHLRKYQSKQSISVPQCLHEKSHIETARFMKQKSEFTRTADGRFGVNH